MNDHDFKKGIEGIKKVELSGDEKKAMLSTLSTYADFHAPKQKVEKLWSWSFMQTKGVYFARAFTLLLLVTGTSYAAEKSLPGDILYPFKIYINEPVQGSLLTTAEDKASFESDRFIRRVGEAEMLASQGKLDETRLQEIEKQIDKHFQKQTEFSNVTNLQTQNNVRLAPQANSIETQTYNAERSSAKMAAQQVPAPMMFMQTSVSDSATFGSENIYQKDAFETKIEEYRLRLENTKTLDNATQNQIIDKLEQKLEEKVAEYAELKMNLLIATSTLQEKPVIEIRK